MDKFGKYFSELMGGTAQTPWHVQMTLLNAAKTMLAYSEHHYHALRFMAKLLWKMGHQGEAYRVALSLPPEEMEDCAGIIKAVEVDETLSASLSFNFEIITLCNLRCPMCFHNKKELGNKRIDNQGGKIMALADFKHIWNKIRRRADNLFLTGLGETFMHPDIYDILEHVAPTPVYIDTNANIKLDAERVVRSSLKSLVFSVDGVDQRTYEPYRQGGDFQKVVENIQAVVDARKKLGRGPLLTLKYVVFKHNEAYLDEVQNLSKRLGMDRLQIVPCLTGPMHDRDLISRFFPHGRHRGLSRISRIDYGSDAVDMMFAHDSPYCTGAMDNPNIRVDGTVTPCCSSTLDGMGNLLENSFNDIWRSEAYREFRLAALRNRYQLAPCRKCSRDHMNHLGRLFDGTELESPRPPAISDDVLNLGELRIGADYAAWLLDNGLTRDIEYYRESGVLSPEAEALLSGFGRPGAPARTYLAKAV